MKKNIIRNEIGLILSIIVLGFLVSVTVSADTAIDLNSLNTIGNTTENTTNSTVTNNSTTNSTTTNSSTANSTTTNNAAANNTTSSTTNNTTNNTTVLPKTGSNTEIVFAVGLIVLISTSIYIYRKSKI